MALHRFRFTNWADKKTWRLPWWFIHTSRERNQDRYRESDWSLSLSLSQTNVNISTWYNTFHLVTVSVPFPFLCSVNMSLQPKQRKQMEFLIHVAAILAPFSLLTIKILSESYILGQLFSSTFLFNCFQWVFRRIFLA